MDNQFTQRVSEILLFSKEESDRLGNNYVGTGHLLLGIIREGDNKAVSILQSLYVDLKKLKLILEDELRGQVASPVRENFFGSDKDLDKKASKVMKLSILEAKLLKSPEVDTEHVLLAIMKDNENKAAEILESQEVTYRKVMDRLVPHKEEPKDGLDFGEEDEDKNARIQQIEEQIADKSKLNEQEYQRKAFIQKQIGEKRLQLNSRMNEIATEANKGRNEASLKLNELEYSLRTEKASLDRKRQSVAAMDIEIEKLNTKLSALRGEFSFISKEELTYNEGEFICPTCKRPLEIEDIEAKQREMQANFNANKAARLKANKEAGMAKKQRLEEMQGLKDRTNAEIEELEQKIERINADIQQAKASIPEAQNVEAMIASDQTCIDIKNEIVELENQLKVDAKIVDVSELQSEKRTLNEAVQGLYKRLANREQIGRAEKEIASLEEKRIANNQKLADLEKWEFTALQFQKDKDAELLKRINGMFRYVSFSFVNEQLNGGEKLTCVCTVNGTPFLDVNNAGQINAGIDIINAICTAKGVSAPIFVDNAESVNQIIPSLSQIIRLVVTTDKELTIK
jgi:chromosome segregation ATPase